MSERRQYLADMTDERDGLVEQVRTLEARAETAEAALRTATGRLTAGWSSVRQSLVFAPPEGQALHWNRLAEIVLSVVDEARESLEG